MGIFDQIIAKVSAEDRAIFDKYPELRASTEQLEENFTKATRFAGEWVNWQKTNWDPETGMTKRERALSDELNAAQLRLQEGIDTGAGANEVAALRKEFETKLEATKKDSLQAIEGMNHFYGAISNRLIPHQQEFKENLDANKVMTFMQQNKINDPDVAYEKMVAGRRSELAAEHAKELEAKHAADIAAAEQRGMERKAQELAMGPSGLSPTDNTGGIAGITSRIDKPATISDEVRTKVEGSKLGDGSLASLGYDLFRQGAFSEKVQ